MTRRRNNLDTIVTMETNIRNLRIILLDKYGPGENAELRHHLFERLQQLAIKFGEPAYRTIEGVAGISKFARQPDRFFCSIVLRRLAEQGFIDSTEDDLR